MRPAKDLTKFVPCLDLMLGNHDQLARSACKAQIDDYLLALKWFGEIQSKGTDQDVYKRLVELRVKQKFSDSATLACLINSLRVYHSDTPCFKHIAALLRTNSLRGAA